MNKFKKILVILLALFLTGFAGLKAQTVLSPYSNFGYGNLYKTNHPVIESMGLLGYGYRDNLVINYQNPASYTAIDTLRFIFDGAASLNALTLSTNTESGRNVYTGFNHIQMGFPIWKYIKASVGLIPFSNVGYNVKSETTDEELGKQLYTFNAIGGINNFYGGLGFQIWKFSLGVNVSYLFGNINKSQMLSAPDSAFYFNVKKIHNTRISSVAYDLGTQFYTKLSESKDIYLSIGASYRPQLQLTGKDYLFKYTFLSTGSGAEQIYDTIAYALNEKGATLLPQKVGFGFMIKKLNAFKVMANADWTQWSKLDITGMESVLTDEFNTSIGVEFTPRGNSKYNYFRWMKYRVGAYYGQPGICFGETKVNQFGMTFGLSFPIARSFSNVNLSLDIGRRGTKMNNLIQESYVKATFGLSIIDTWFYRIKYN